MATIVVTNLNNIGAGSLRQALVDANATVGIADSIVFSAGLTGMITLSGGNLDLTDDITINGDTNGDGRADITLSGGNAQRIFHQFGVGTDVVLKSLTLTGGNAANVGGSYGGAILASFSGTLEIVDTTISGNTALQGGGIYATGTTVSLTNSLVSANTSTSVFSGGGIYFRGDTLTLTNSTIYGNSSNGRGGGISAVGAGSLKIYNSTITHNHADADGAEINRGGGIDTSVITTITNSVIADNTSGAATENDVGGNVSTAINSVFGTANTVTTNTASLIGVADVGLGTLGFHGGTTATRQIVAIDSVLLNAGSNAGAAGLATDANGNLRIQQGTVDIGATESSLITVTNLNDQGVGSLRAALTLANSDPGFDKIVFTAGMTGTINLASGLILTNNVSISGDTNGDGDADITLTGGGSDTVVTVNFNVTAILESLVFSGITQDTGASAIWNAGTLNVNYSVFSGNAVLGLGVGSIASGGTVFNTGIIGLVQSVFANNSAKGQNGTDGVDAYFATNGANGGNASASVLNSGNLSVRALAIIGGTASGGTGGNGGNGMGGNYNFGGKGGNGGNAAIGILNQGSAVGTLSNQFPGSISQALGGYGGGGFSPGAPGQLGQISTTNLTFAGGTSNFSSVLTGSQNADANSTIAAGQKFYGLGGADILTGAAGSSIFGGANNDVLTSSRGSSIVGGLGNDVLRTTYLGSQTGGGTWYGGAGIDTFDASLSGGNYVTGGGLTLNLATGANNFGGTVALIENIIGTNNAAWSDVLTGDGGANNIQGLAGIDTLEGKGGADILNGGTNTAAGDTLSYASSLVSVSVNLALNTATGGDATGDIISNFENVTGTAQGDQLVGDAGANVLRGGAGNDLFVGGLGVDTMIGGADLDVVDYSAFTAGVAVDLTSGTGTGGDVISEIENISGSAFGDVLIGDNGANTLRGGVGNDFFVAGNGADLLIGGADNDEVSYETATTGVFVNLITGTGANGGVLQQIENIRGSAFGDVLQGDNGANTIRGLAGNDFIIAGNGADLLIGGADNDTVSYETATTGVFANLATGVGANGGVLQEIENLTGSAFGDVLMGSVTGNTLKGGAGNDFIAGNNGSDALFGGADNDTFRFDTAIFGNDVIADYQDNADHISFGNLVATSFGQLTIQNNGTTNVTVQIIGQSIVVQGVANITLTASDFLFV